LQNNKKKENGGIKSTRIGKGRKESKKRAKLRGLCPKEYFINIPRSINYNVWTLIYPKLLSGNVSSCGGVHVGPM
jgi:hypothetical protein